MGTRQFLMFLVFLSMTEIFINMLSICSDVATSVRLRFTAMLSSLFSTVSKSCESDASDSR